eukprot:scaffold63044_cov56-Attheya_sp.AAC.4
MASPSKPKSAAAAASAAAGEEEEPKDPSSLSSQEYLNTKQAQKEAFLQQAHEVRYEPVSSLHGIG